MRRKVRGVQVFLISGDNLTSISGFNADPVANDSYRVSTDKQLACFFLEFRNDLTLLETREKNHTGTSLRDILLI